MKKNETVAPGVELLDNASGENPFFQSKREQDETLAYAEQWLEAVRKAHAEGSLQAVICGLAANEGSNVGLNGSALFGSYMIHQMFEYQLSMLGHQRVSRQMHDMARTMTEAGNA